LSQLAVHLFNKEYIDLGSIRKKYSGSKEFFNETTHAVRDLFSDKE